MNANRNDTGKAASLDRALDSAIDSTITRALHALASAEPEPGLESRVLHRLHRRELSRGTRRRAWLTASPRTAALASACVLALLTAGALHLRNTANSRPPLANARAVPQPLSPATHDASLAGRVTIPHARTVAMRTPHSVASASGAYAAPPLAPETEEAHALADMLAPSTPEPPLPLTRQERLLLRIAQTREAPALAQFSLAAEAERERRAEETQQVLVALSRDLFSTDTNAATQLSE